MDLSRFPRRRYTNFATPLEFLPNFTQALAASCPGGKGPRIWIKRDDMLGLFPGDQELQLARLVAAGEETQHVVALDPDARALAAGAACGQGPGELGRNSSGVAKGV